ncbi:hypothetical protein [Verrucosispora sp. WMMC514]|uniref:restriction endonuclease n=1 Tax=Verrucosispora sp. WMMC514 TaxID=3015156 RepID=UPI00248D0D5C|nr:hypothetical protein [Verrucosispora sp. WMMC514]WBB92109.1 hypothetical protein O7597_03515 [Verrucosispora sp. WMMC514]
MAEAWIVRAGREDDYEKSIFKHNIISIGWSAAGDLTSRSTQQDIKDVVRANYPEVEPRSADTYAIQLFAFRSRMRVGDLVLLLRRTSPDVAVGWVTGSYQYRADLGRTMRHVRPVNWVRTDLPRSVLATELLNLPALATIFRINQPDVVERMRRLLGGATPEAPDAAADQPVTAQESGPFVNLQRNLNYARNLATAGQHLAQLKVRAFEVDDVFRAAWVQAVAALDHWVRQEIRERMRRLAEQPDAAEKFQGFGAFSMTLGLFQQVQQGKLTLAEALDQQLRQTHSHLTYQNPNKIREGFALVGNVNGLWDRVARVLSEQAGDGVKTSGIEVQQQLREIVRRRNKIAHEYDEDPQNAPRKRPIDAAATTQTIDWIEQLAGAIVAALEQE